MFLLWLQTKPREKYSMLPKKPFTLMRAKEKSEKAGLKLNIQKREIMASGLTISWQIEGEKVETVTEFIWGAPKSLLTVIAAMKLKDAYSLEEKL